MTAVLIEGWFGVPHSHAIVFRNQVRCWLSDREKRLFFRPVSFPFVETIGEPRKRDFIDVAIAERRWRGEPVSAVYRSGFPFDLGPAPSPGAKVFLLLTFESAMPDDRMFANGNVETLRRGAAEGWLVPVVPSRWCVEALQSVGVEAKLVPLGVDCALFRPEARRPKPNPLIPFAEDRFVYLSIGAMTTNKGIELLLRAFSRVWHEQPRAALVLKGLDTLYRSSDRLQAMMADAGLADEALRSSIHSTGAELGADHLASLAAGADAYVAPYSAEGFCLPALEALASGVCVLASAGGPTDDFLPETLAASWRIEATRRDAPGLRSLDVSEDDLVRGMGSVMAEPTLRDNARNRGPRFVRDRYTWELGAAQLWELFG